MNHVVIAILAVFTLAVIVLAWSMCVVAARTDREMRGEE